MKFRIFVYVVAIITGLLIRHYGLGVDKNMETLFSSIIILLGGLNIIYELIKLMQRENKKRNE